jgi:hypothetical protein
MRGKVNLIEFVLQVAATQETDSSEPCCIDAAFLKKERGRTSNNTKK